MSNENAQLVAHDDRAYLYRYIAESEQWGFIAANNTGVNKQPITLCYTEKWEPKNGNKEEVYTLYSVCYSKEKAQQLIEKRDKSSLIELAFAMSGPDIFQLFKGTELKCVAWCPANTEGLVEISRISDNAHRLIEGHLSFDVMRQHIYSLMEIDAASMVIHQPPNCRDTNYHIVE